MNFLGLGSIIDSVGKVADDLITTKEEKLQIALKEKELDTALLQGQMEINKTEAQHGSVFVAGWRPFIGWIGGLALAYQFILYPLLVWAFALLQAWQVIPCDLPGLAVSSGQCSVTAPPPLDASLLMTIVTGMLGIGGMRSFDKMKKTDTKVVSRGGR